MAGASIQTTFEPYFNVAKLGMKWDRRELLTESYAVEGGIIRYAQAVVAGTDPTTQIATPSVTGQVFRGITLALWQIEQTLTAYPTTSSGEFQVGMVAPVVRRGGIWVRVNTDVSADEPVYMVFSDVDPTKIGNFQNVAGSPVVADLVAGARFRTSALAGGLAVVELNLPTT